MKKNNKIKSIVTLIVLLLIVISILLSLFFFLKTKKNNDIYSDKVVNPEFSFLVKESSTEVVNNDMITAQKKIKEELLNNFKKGKYDLSNPYVVVNPFADSPQTALIMFKTKKSEEVTITVKGKHNDDLVTKFEATKEHIIPVYGLYNHHDNQVVISTPSGNNTITIRIDEDIYTGDVEVEKNDISNSNGEFYFATSSLGVGSMAYDNYGEIRWWLNIGYTKGITMLNNGHIMLSSTDEGPDTTSTNGVVELDMLGYLYNQYEIEGGYHHDAYQMSDDGLIILTSDPTSTSFADYIVRIDPSNGKITKEWDIKKKITEIDPNLIQESNISWGWINSVSYDKYNNALILSVRNQNSVVSIDYETGNINWILGEKKYWSDKFNDYLITGSGEEFIYPMGQHSITVLDNNRISIFNNGYDAHLEQEVSCASLRSSASYAIIYDINKENKTASISYKFGGSEYFSYALSSYTYSLDNHKVFNSGWHFTNETEYDSPRCTQFSNDKYDAYVIDFDKDNKEVVKLHIKESKFEVVKAPIYNLNAVATNSTIIDKVPNYDLTGSGRYLSTANESSYTKLSKEEVKNFSTNEVSPFNFLMFNYRFKFNGILPINSKLDVVFITPQGEGYKYTYKESGKEAINILDINGLPNGRYYIYGVLDDSIFNTTQHIIKK